MNIESKTIQLGADFLREGKLVAFPTETVYGLGADARNGQAVKRIFEAKGRPSDHPLIVHLGSAEQMREWAKSIPETAWQLAEAFWPGPLTLILPRADGVSDVVTGGFDTVALRVPEHPVALELLKTFGGGIAAPSANRYGRVSPTCASDVQEELADKVDLILDGGRCQVGIESTIVDLSSSTPRLLRPGKITEEMLIPILGDSLSTAVKTQECYPGGNLSHYAPNARVVLTSKNNVLECIEASRQTCKRVGLLSTYLPEGLSEPITWLPLPKTIEEQAFELYHALRQADELELDVVVALMPENIGIGHAICDRLRRSAGLG